MTSVMNYEHFRIQVQNLTEQNKELQTINRLLFNKVSLLKIKIKDLETEFEKKHIIEFDGFEIIDFIEDK